MYELALGISLCMSTLAHISHNMQNDQLWNELYSRFGGDEQKTKAVWRMKKSYSTIRAQRESKKIRFIRPEDIPARKDAGPRATRASMVTCQAVTLSGKKCKFKATCGNFCKKHQL